MALAKGAYKCAPPAPTPGPAKAAPSQGPTPAKAMPATANATPGQWLNAAPTPATAKQSAAAAGVQSPDLCVYSDVAQASQVIVASSRRQENSLCRLEESLVGLSLLAQGVQKTAQTNSDSLDLLAGRVHGFAETTGLGANLAMPFYDYIAPPGLVFVLLFCYSCVW